MKKTKRAPRGNGTVRTLPKSEFTQVVPAQPAMQLSGASSTETDTVVIDGEQLEKLQQIDRGMVQARVMLGNAVLAMFEAAGRASGVDAAYRNEVTEIAKAKGINLEENWSFNLQTATYTRAPQAQLPIPTQTSTQRQ